MNIYKLVLVMFLPLTWVSYALTRFKNSNTKISTPVATLLCKKHLLSYIIMISSLRYVTSSEMRLVAINDGSLGSVSQWLLKMFGVEIANVNKEVPWQTLKYMEVAKLFNRDLIYIDPDIVFVRTPFLLFEKDRYFFMDDILSRYSFSDREIVKNFHVNVLPRVNTGVLKLNPLHLEPFVFRKVFELISKMSMQRNINYHFLEQTAFAILFSKINKGGEIYKRLPTSYFLFSKKSRGKQEFPADLVCIHFTSLNRRALLRYNILLLLKSCFFLKKIHGL